MTLFQQSRSQIFKDARCLQPLSDPPGGKPLDREADLKTMASLLSALFKTGVGNNLFICGPPGTGKTICVQYLLSEIHRHAEKYKVPLATVYVNAGKTRTPYYTMLEIVKELGLNVPDSGWQMFRLKKAFENILKEKTVIIAVDEVDALLLKEREPLVYYLNRQPKTTLILISNKLKDAISLPKRALSTLQPKLVKLEPYTPEEAKTILKQRAKKAFHPNTLSDKLLTTVAQAAAEAQDIRLGFTILLTAGLLAEENGKSKVEAEDINLAIKSESTIELLQELEALKKKVEAMQQRGKQTPTQAKDDFGWC
ncbi:MAG: AAA family ATPase [Candidatus Bathyarchaeota archaeon]|nr:AAA family ATPase [Candidatus Bathyarchaeota archaeon]